MRSVRTRGSCSEAIEESFGVDLGDYYALAGIGVGELASKICGLANYPVEASCLSGERSTIAAGF
jgi:hypothetical protein